VQRGGLRERQRKFGAVKQCVSNLKSDDRHGARAQGCRDPRAVVAGARHRRDCFGGRGRGFDFEAAGQRKGAV